MTKILNKTSELLFNSFLILTMVWIVVALSTQVFFIYLEFTNQQDRMRDISNKVTWKIDGRFKNNPDNIWYEGPVNN
jgi:hypothetical protein